MGSFVGVPLELSDGRPVGTLCAMSRELHAYTAGRWELLTVLSRLLAYELERERREQLLER